MRHLFTVSVSFFFAFCSSVSPSKKDGEQNKSYVTANPNFNTLVWADEFDYEGSPDPEKWHHQTFPPKNGSWFGNELQHYTARKENSYVSSGTLKIIVKKEDFTTENSKKDYTSARLNSKFDFQYGRVEVRAKLPISTGTWPAIWTLGSDINEPGNVFGDRKGNNPWPMCGEIDILEQNGWDKNKVISHLHWGDTFTKEYKHEGGELKSENTWGDFHLYHLIWDEKYITIFYDNQISYQMENTADIPYDSPHYILLNVAIGGTLGGDVPQNFTQDQMEIDYVRIYQ